MVLAVEAVEPEERAAEGKRLRRRWGEGGDWIGNEGIEKG